MKTWLNNLFPVALFLLFFVFNQQLVSQTDPLTYKPVWEKAGYPGEIPDISTNIINVKDHGAAGNGTTDDYAAIQNIIDNATTPAVVWFPAGTYRINNQLSLKSGVVLRGDGFKQTHLEFYSQDGCISARGALSGNYVSVTRGLSKGSSQLEVADAAGFVIGDGAHFRQGNVIETTLTSWVEPRSPGQTVRITAITGNTLTIDPPLNFDYASNPPLNSSHGPEISPVRFIEQFGIEEMHIKRIHSDNGNGSNVNITRAADFWIRGVESDYTLKYHFAIAQSLNFDIRKNYIHHARSRGDGGQGYGVSLAYQTTAGLIEDNIFYECRHSMIVQLGVNGCVFGYNYAERNFSDDGWDKTYISLHGHYVHMNLFEGNVVGWIGVGDYWGPDGPDNTFLRNRVLGTDRHETFGDNRGIMYADFDGPQYIIGNEVSGGDIYFVQKENSQSNPSLVMVHGNNIKGTVSWQTGNSNRTIPDSYYLNNTPAFFENHSWPPFGGDNVIGNGTIPALERRNSEEYINPTFLDKINKQEETHEIRVFPNPSDGNFKVEVSNVFKWLSIKVLSPNGQILFEKQIAVSGEKNITEKLNLTSLKTKVFIIEIKADGKLYSKKLVTR